jgi:hypothetical protein
MISVTVGRAEKLNPARVIVVKLVFETLIDPEDPAPTTPLIVVAFTIVNELAAVPPKVTPVTPVKLVPLKVTISPVPA